MRPRVRRIDRGEPGRDPDVGDNDFQFVGRHHLANNLLHLPDLLVGQFQPGAGGRFEIDHKLPRVRPGKIRLTHQRIEPQAQHKYSRYSQHRCQWPQQGQTQPAFVAIQHPIEFPVESGVKPRPPASRSFRPGRRMRRMTFDQLGTKQWHHRQRHHIRRQQRKDHRQCQGDEQKPAYPVQKRNREKDHHRRQRRREHRQGHFASATFRRHLGSLTKFDMAENVLQHHHRVVNQPGKRQRQTAQHHRIDGVISHAQGDKRRECRKRYGEKHRHRGPHAAEKNQNHHAGEHQANGPFVNQVFNCVAHKDGLVKHHLRNQLLRHIQQMSHAILDAVHHGNRVGIAALL